MKKIIYIILGCVALFVLQSVAFADIYQYETDSGDTIFSSTPRSGLRLVRVISSSDKGSSGATKKSPSQPGASSSKAGTSAAPSAPSASRRTETPRGHSEKAYDDMILEASKAYDIPFSFIKAVIKIESNYDPGAVSSAGAVGLMQLMPATLESMGIQNGRDARENIFAGTKYLRRLADRYNGDINLILSAYNAGSGNVDNYHGIPFEKTRQYVQNVYYWYLLYEAEYAGTDFLKTDVDQEN